MKRKLEIENSHERDKRIQFDEDSHTYTVDGSKFKGSVTTFWGDFFDHFEAKPVINKCFRKWKSAHDDKYGYFILYMIVVQGFEDRQQLISGLKELHDDCAFHAIIAKFPFLATDDQFSTLLRDRELVLNDKGYFWLIQYFTRALGLDDAGCKCEISKFWTSLGTRASTEGTYMHLQLELFNNEDEYDGGLHEVKLYRQFVRDHPWLKPFRTEWSVFSTDVHLAGQIDLVVQDIRFNPPKFYIIDFKRCKELLNSDNPYNKYGKAPFHQVPDTPFGHYSVQQAAYRWFLETLYGVTISKCYLLQLHPSRDTYNFVRLPNLRDNLNMAIKNRL